MIEIRNVYKFFDNKAINENVSFNFDSGILVILGPNGAGKTTLLRQIYGDLKPDKGEILIDGFDPSNRRAKKLLGVLPQNMEPIFNLTVYDHIKIFGKIRRISNLDDKIKEVIEKFNLNPKERVNKLSVGQRRKVLLASILILDSKYLILDEPTVGLDIDSRNLVYEVLKNMTREGKGVILTTHYLDEAERLATRVLLFFRKVLFDGPKERLVREVFMDDIYIVKIDEKKLFVKNDEVKEILFKLHGKKIEIRKPTLEELYYEFFKQNN
jgi:ABC-2 type transport system ATP-binding protein